MTKIFIPEKDGQVTLVWHEAMKKSLADAPKGAIEGEMPELSKEAGKDYSLWVGKNKSIYYRERTPALVDPDSGEVVEPPGNWVPLGEAEPRPVAETKEEQDNGV